MVFTKTRTAATVVIGFIFCVTLMQTFALALEHFKEAKEYIENGDFEQAMKILQTIVANSPSTDNALIAQRELILLYYSAGRKEEAQKALEELISNFPRSEKLASALYAIARKCESQAEKTYEPSKEHEQAQKIYKQITRDYPGTPIAFSAQEQFTMLQITLGKDTQENLNRVIASYSNDEEHRARALSDIAQRYKPGFPV
jgi:TolA-binding protein